MSRLWPAVQAASAARVDDLRALCADPSPSFTPWGVLLAAPGALPAVEPEPDPAEREAAAFALGWEEGRRAADAELAAERDALRALAEALPALRPEPTDALAVLLGETVERLVRQVVGEAGVDPALLRARAAAAAALLGEECGPSRLRVHPDDLSLLADAALPVPLLADPALARGSLLLETAAGWLEDGPEVRLARLREELGRLGATSGEVPDEAAPSPVHAARRELAARLREPDAPGSAAA